MKRWMFPAALALCMILVLLPGRAEAAEAVSGSWGTNLTWTYNPANTTLTISGQGEMASYRSPGGGSPSLYSYTDEITRVVIEEGVTTIASSAFYYWSWLSSVSLPQSLRIIKDGAFGGCTKLTKLTIPDSVEYIGDSAFWESGLKEVNIPSRLVEICTYTFWDCTSLETVTIPGDSRLARISYGAFSGCNELKGITIPKGVKYIESDAFRNCAQFTQLEIPEGVTDIGDYAFAGCSNLTSISLPKSLGDLPSDSYAEISYGMFSECASLKEITIPTGVEAIYSDAFAKCAQLTTVNIPGTVTNIGSKCFRECPALTTINYGGAEWQWKRTCENSSSNIGIGDSVTVNCLPGGACGKDVYWSYDEQNNLLYIAGDGAVERPTDGSADAWDEALGKNPFIFVVDAESIGTNDLAGRTVHRYERGWFDSSSLPAGTVLHEMEWEAATKSSEQPCVNGGHTEGYRCERDCTVPEILRPREFGPLPHEVTSINQSPTCVSTGLECGQKCRTCGEILVEPLTRPINSANHRGEREVLCEELIKAPTETESGAIRITYLCKDCNRTFTEDKTLAPGTIPDIGGPYDPTKPIIYTITFDPNGGALAPGPNTKNTRGDRKLTALPANPTRENFAFQGWYTSPAEGEGTKITTALVFMKDATVYAHWTERTGNTFTITFDANDGSGDSIFDIQVTGPDGRLDAMPALNPARDGYTFSGWFTEASGGAAVNTSTLFTEDSTVYAHWTSGENPPHGGPYTITLDPNGGTVDPKTIQTTVGGELTAALPTPSHDHPACYTFKGWYTEDGSPVSTSTVFQADATIHAGWEEKHTLKTLPGKAATCTEKGLTEGSQCTVCGKVVTEQEEIPALGHNWVVDGSGTETITKKPTCTEEGSKTITNAKCSRCGISGGSITVAIPAAGHAYGEWKTVKEPTATQPGTKERVCTVCGDKQTEAIPATGTDKPGTDEPGADPSQTYTVTFDANGGTGGAKLTTGTDGRLAALPRDPTRTGYAFAGWFTAASGGNAVSTATVFRGDATVYAHWTGSNPSETLYPIRVPSRVAGGSFRVSHSAAAEGTRVTIEAAPRSGYELDWLSATNLRTGWEIPLTMGYRSEFAFVMPASAVEVDLAFISQSAAGGGSGGSTTGYVPSQTAPQVRPQFSAKPVGWYLKDGQIWHVTSGAVPTGTPLTRDMLLSVLYNMDETSAGEQLLWAAEHSVIPDLYASGLWGQDKNLTREQTALILYGYSRYKGYNVSSSARLNGYADYSQLRPAAREAMSWAQAIGLMTTASPNRLSPQGNLSCGDANAILSLFLALVARPQ